MAGHRRAHRGQPTQPTQRATRRARRRMRMAQRYAAALTPVARLEVAHDYLRGAAARRQPDSERVARLIDDLARQLIAAADQLLAW